MRGTPTWIQRGRPAMGIIPAYAGNTRGAVNTAEVFWDHPRVCGEHPMLLAIVLVLPGSSPRMRGTLNMLRFADDVAVIIPAYAGNTIAQKIREKYLEDHPRVCGEHFKDYEIDDMLTGSSPRMRGTRDARNGAVRVPGIIPAYAGNTLQ